MFYSLLYHLVVKLKKNLTKLPSIYKNELLKIKDISYVLDIMKVFQNLFIKTVFV